MKKIYLCLLAICLTGTACEEKEVCPQDVPFTEYYLTNQCQWTSVNIKHEDFNGKVIIINSYDELENYITCNVDSSYYHAIDFSEYTLLLAAGVPPTEGHSVPINTTFIRKGRTEYDLNLIIIHSQGLATVILPWYSTILTPKIASETTIALNVKYIEIVRNH